MVTKEQLLAKANQLGKVSMQYHKYHTEFMKLMKDYLGIDDFGNSFSDSFIDTIEQTGCENITMNDIDVWIKDFKQDRSKIW